MKLNHMGLAVTDVVATAELLENYFGFIRPPHTPVNAKMGFLLDDEGTFLTLFKTDDAIYPEIFHIGFMQETVEQVNIIHEKLKAGGYEVEDIREEWGRMTFYFNAPGNFMVEVNSLINAKKPELKSMINEN